jgi:hypothetical protein
MDRIAISFKKASVREFGNNVDKIKNRNKFTSAAVYKQFMSWCW